MLVWIKIQIQIKCKITYVLKVEEGEDISSTEELNPDCYVVVYAVDDEQSFGEYFLLSMLSMSCLWRVHVVFVFDEHSFMDFSSFYVVA